MRKFKLLMTLVVLALVGCCVRDMRWDPIRPARGSKYRVYKLKTTGYCPCGECCGWKRNWYGRPVISSGPRKGKPKAVGITSSGARAKPGTIAADTSIFPYGTIMYVPGYGYGRVEDIGSGIKGRHVDLYFRYHGVARKWGVQYKEVKVWFPRRR